jgi:hypothetical protein
MANIQVLKKIKVELTAEEREELLTRSYGMFTQSGNRRLGEIMVMRFSRGIEVMNSDDDIAKLVRTIQGAATRNKKFAEADDTAVRESLGATIESLLGAAI